MGEILQYGEQYSQNSQKKTKSYKPYIVPNYLSQDEDLPDLDAMYDDKKNINKSKKYQEKKSEYLNLEKENFKVESKDWKIEKVESDLGEILVKVNPEGDIWEYQACENLPPELVGEQLFTWESSVRELKKQGKKMYTISPKKNQLQDIVDRYTQNASNGSTSEYQKFLEEYHIKMTGYREPNGYFRIRQNCYIRGENQVEIRGQKTDSYYCQNFSRNYTKRDFRAKNFGLSLRCLG